MQDFEDNKSLFMFTKWLGFNYSANDDTDVLCLFTENN